MKEEDPIYEAYRYNRNKKKIIKHGLFILIMHLLEILMNVLLLYLETKFRI